MADKLRVATIFAFLFILGCTGAHVAGLLTDFWLTGTSDIEDAVIKELSVGMWSTNVKYSNGTEMETASNLLRREVHYIVMAVAGMNVLMCFVVICKAVHVCVGLIAFIVISLMILCTFYTHEGMIEQKERLQEFHTDWPELSLSWSFYLVFLGLLVNIFSTLAFLAVVLVRGEIKAEKTKLDVGQFAVKQNTTRHKTQSTTTVVSTVTADKHYDNYTFKDESARAQWSTDSTSGHALPSSESDTIDLDDVDIQRNSSAQPSSMHVGNARTTSSRDHADFSDITVVYRESIRL